MTFPAIDRKLIVRIGWGITIAVAVAWVVTQVLGVYSEAFNWDELALFNRVEHTRVFGELDGGGRPGLAVLVLMPFVGTCSASVATMILARWLWVGITLLLLAGLFVFTYRAQREGPWRWTAAALATACLALVPVFMRWSVQVRTDQPSATAVVWAGVFVLASRKRPVIALAAGALGAVGYLFSQKAIYVGGLVTVVALGELVRDGEFLWKRELKRVGLALAALAATIVLYDRIVSQFYTPPPSVSLSSGMKAFANYRWLFGLKLYPNMLPSLIPQLLLVLGTLGATIHAFVRHTAHRRTNVLALVVLGLGIFVGWFHAGAFPYFWIVLGLFPATAIGIAWPGLAASLGRTALPFLGVVAALFLWIAIPYRHEVLQDTQTVQRNSFTFIERDLVEFRGFSPDGGLFCRNDPEPMDQWFREAVQPMYHGEAGAKMQKAFIGEFVKRPVAYILDTFLADPFPPPVQAFWASHYVRYAYTVSLAGQRITGRTGMTSQLDVIVPGTYRWHGDARISIAGRELPPGGTIELPVGLARIQFLVDTSPALFTLAVPTPPNDQNRAFHSVPQILEIIGTRSDW